MKKMLLILIAGVLALTAGCARTVTPIVDYGETMIVDVTLRGTADAIGNRYFVVMSSNSAFKVPLPPPDYDEQTPEFLEPGDVPLVGSIEAYYSKYYAGWTGYVYVDPGGYTLVTGPFVNGVAATREAVGNLETITSKLSFTFNLAKLFGTTIPDNIYFDVISVPWPDGQAKIPVDHLASTNASISKISGSILTVDDIEDSSLPASRDIVRCRVEIQ